MATGRRVASTKRYDQYRHGEVRLATPRNAAYHQQRSRPAESQMLPKDLDENAFARLLKENFTPSSHITSPERLFGREDVLTKVRRALLSAGRQVVIYGDKGVGKTSIGLTTAYLLNSSKTEPIYVVCGSSDSFGSVLQNIAFEAQDIRKRFEKPGAPPSFGGGYGGASATFNFGGARETQILAPSSINDALALMKYVASIREGQTIVVVDEMERMENEAERKKFAEFIKNCPALGDHIKFIFSGISTTVEELLGAHTSAERIIEAIFIEPLRHGPLWKIITNFADQLEIHISREQLIRISQISDGFPHFVHLIGECLFWNLYDSGDWDSGITQDIFRKSITGAIQRAEPRLKLDYEKATMKTKLTDEYEETLWALADKRSDRRQLSDIFESSYKRIIQQPKARTRMERSTLNARLLTLRSSNHRSVVVGYGAGWFGFRENMFRGYCRLVAELHGIRLGLHD